jgi:protein gp37
MSTIPWTRKSWNPITGCTKIAQGCKNCYAERLSLQYQSQGIAKFAKGFNPTLHPSTLDKPSTWKKSTMIFVCSVSDLFHDDIPFDFQKKIFDTIRFCPQHIFQILTKRSANMVKVVKRYEKEVTKLHNVWYGISVSTPKDLHDHAVNLNAMRGLRYLSIEPILETGIEIPYWIEWVILGGESGPNARHSELKWYRQIKQQCFEQGIKLFIKQIHAQKGKLVDNLEEFPFDLRVQQFPNARNNQVGQTASLFK